MDKLDRRSVARLEDFSRIYPVPRYLNARSSKVKLFYFESLKDKNFCDACEELIVEKLQDEERRIDALKSKIYVGIIVGWVSVVGLIVILEFGVLVK